jgi:DNA-binding LytR/AlgR family response regulator
MKAVIIEDEAVAAQRLERLLLEIAPDTEVLATLGSVKTAAQWLRTHRADLIFLDIQLSDGLSFSIFESVPVSTPVILTTAYDQYAIKAFELNSIAYLLKPIRRSALEEALNKYQSLRTAFAIDFSALQEVMRPRQHYRERFLIQVGEVFRKVETIEVAYFFSAHKSTFLRTQAGKTYDLDLSLDRLEPTLDPARFFRINRKYIVSMRAIDQMIAWSRSRVKLKLNPPPDEEQDTIVSIDRAGDFKAWMDH